jgi:hypothetical protein
MTQVERALELHRRVESEERANLDRATAMQSRLAVREKALRKRQHQHSRLAVIAALRSELAEDVAAAKRERKLVAASQSALTYGGVAMRQVCEEGVRVFASVDALSHLAMETRERFEDVRADLRAKKRAALLKKFEAFPVSDGTAPPASHRPAPSARNSRWS